MAFFDRFKGNKGSKGKKGVEPNVLDMVQESGSTKKGVLSAEGGSASGGKENTGRAHHVLHRHHLSEKTNVLSASGRYVFKVAKTTNKLEVKKAIEAVYAVHVAGVNMINVPGKNRRQGKSRGRTQDWKKAIVTLKSGERISGLSEGV